MQIQEKDFRGFIKGDEKSFEIIFHQYYTTLVSFAMRFGLEEMAAEDAVIETMYHIWKIRHEVKSPAALHVLFYTSVRNQVLTLLRNLKNHNRIIEENQDKLADLQTEKAFYDLIRREEMGRIWDCALKELPPQCQRVVLGLLDGKTVAEIAEEMAITVNSVKTYKLRAMGILKQVLKNYPYLLTLLLIHLNHS